MSNAYRLGGRKADGEVLDEVIKSINTLATAYFLTEDLTRRQFNEFTDILSIKRISSDFELLRLERYAPIKKVMELGKGHVKKSKFEKKLSAHSEKFLAICLRMKESELKEFSTKLEQIQIHSEKGTKGDRFLAALLGDPRFSSLHEICALLLLRRKKYHFQETVEQFDKRANGDSVKAAIDFILNKIQDLQSNPSKEKELKDYIFSLIKNNRELDLSAYKPLQSVLQS